MRKVLLILLLWPGVALAQTSTPTRTPTATPAQDFGWSFEGCIAPTPPAVTAQWDAVADLKAMDVASTNGGSIKIVAAPTPGSGHGVCQLQLDRTSGGQTYLSSPLTTAGTSSHNCGRFVFDYLTPPADWTQIMSTKGTLGFKGCTLSYSRNPFTGYYRFKVVFGTDILRCQTSQNDYTPCACTDPDHLTPPCFFADACLNIGSAGEAVCQYSPVIVTEEFPAAAGFGVNAGFNLCLSEQHSVGGPAGVTCKLHVNGQEYAATHPYGVCDSLSGGHQGWACTSDSDCSGGSCLLTGLPIRDITHVSVGDENVDVVATWPTTLWLDTWVYGPGLASTERQMKAYRVNPAAVGTRWTTGMSVSGCAGPMNVTGGVDCIDDLASNATLNDGDTTHVESAIASQQRSWDMTNVSLGAGESVIGANVVLSGEPHFPGGGGSNNRTSRGGIVDGTGSCLGGLQNWTSADYPTGEYRLFDYAWCQKRPDGAFWTESTINAAEMGIQRAATTPAGEIFITAVEGEIISSVPITPPATNITDLNGDGVATVNMMGDSTMAEAEIASALAPRIPGAQNIYNMSRGGSATMDLDNHLAGILAGSDVMFTCTNPVKGICGSASDYLFYQSGANDEHWLPSAEREGVCSGGIRDGLPCACDNRRERITEERRLTGRGVVTDGVSGHQMMYCPNSTFPCGTPMRTCVCCTSSIGDSCEDLNPSAAGLQGRSCTTDVSCTNPSYPICPRLCPDAVCPTTFCFDGCVDSSSCRGGLCKHGPSLATLRNRIQRIVARIAATPTHLIFILPPRPPAGQSGNWGSVADVYQQNRVLYKALAAQYGFSWIDLNLEFVNECHPYLSCFSDGIHKSPVGSGVLAKLMADCLNGVTRDSISCAGV